MNRTIIISLAALLTVATAFGQKGKAKFKTEIDTVSYAMGMAIGSSVKKAGFTEFNEVLFTQALADVLNGKPAVFSEDTINSIIQNYMQKIQTKKLAENTEKGAKFLAENAKKEGVVTLPSGLQYKIIKEGDGVIPSLTSKVTCHYHGTLIDGKVFDSSVQRGEPVQFPVNGVIEGWTEALQLMKAGSKWELFIPSNMAYGDKDIPGIEANSVLIFEVELISVE